MAPKGKEGRRNKENIKSEVREREWTLGGKENENIQRKKTDSWN